MCLWPLRMWEVSFRTLRLSQQVSEFVLSPCLFILTCPKDFVLIEVSFHVQVCGRYLSGRNTKHSRLESYRFAKRIHQFYNYFLLFTGACTGRQHRWQDPQVPALQIVRERRADILSQDHSGLFAAGPVRADLLCQNTGTAALIH